MTNLIPANEYCQSIFDGTHDTPKPVTEGKLLITSKHISGGSLDSSSAYLISEKDYLSIQKRSAVSQWDILFSMIGSVGEVYLEKNPNIPYAIKNMGVFSCKSESEARWLYYYLISPAAKTHIQRYLNGAVQKFLPLGALRNFPVPPYDEAKEPLVKVLSTIDEKIDCNNRINAELESMAKILYDYWFVQFDFPDSRGKPYKSSGGHMTYNDVLKREIPNLWKNSNILAIADVLGGGTPTKKNAEFWGGTIPFFTPTDAGGSIFKFSTTDYITDSGLIGSSTKLFDRYTIFITARGSVGKLVITGVEMAMNQSCYALRSKKDISHVFLFFLAKELIHHLQVKSSGSVFDSIVSNDIELTELAIPPIDLIQQFSAITEPLFEKVSINTKENERLAELRDWLLPMLMNGQVTTS
jgi:type I restriction enzyme S subunit